MYRLLCALLLVMAWLNSSHFGPWVSWHAELPVFVLVFLVAMLGAWRGRAQAEIGLPTPTWLFVGLALVSILQFLAGLVVWRGQFWILAFYLLLIATLVTWGWTEGKAVGHRPALTAAAGEWLGWALIVGCLLSFGIALAQVFQVWEEVSLIARQPYLRRPGGNLAQPNHLATLLVMAVGAAFFLHLHRRLNSVVLGLLVLVFSTGIAVTESRGGLLSMIALCGLCAWKLPGRFPRAWAAASALAAVTLFLTWPAMYSWTGLSTWRDAGLARLESSGGDPRWALWQQMFEASLLKPWFGWGIRNTAEAHNAIAHEVASALPVTYSHNLLLDMAVWWGWPITLILLAVVLVWAWRRLSALNRPLGWFGMALLVPFSIHSALEFPFAYAYLLMPAMLGVGYLESSASEQQASRSLPRWLVAPLVSGVALLGAWSVYDYVRAEEDFRVARFQLLHIGPVPTEPPPKLVLLDQLGDLLASMRVPLQKGLDAAQMDALRKAALHYPWSGSQYRYATALALNGASDEARRQLLVLRAQQGDKTYRVLAMQLDVELIRHGLPALGVLPQKIQ